VNISRRSLFVVVSFVAMAMAVVAVVHAVAVTAVLGPGSWVLAWGAGGAAWFGVCGDGVV
jgi:hypothetical protein